MTSSPTGVRSFPMSEHRNEDEKRSTSGITNVVTTKPTKIKATNEDADSRLPPLHVRRCRDVILDLSVPMSHLCQAVRASSSRSSGIAIEACLDPMAKIFCGLLLLADTSDISFRDAIYHKMTLNKQKYPVELCKGKSGKYTEYSSSTGITRYAGQSLLSSFDLQADSSTSKERTNQQQEQQQEQVDKLPDWWQDAIDMVYGFREERHWGQFHTPRNIVLAMMGEVGELAEVLQFEGDAAEQPQDVKRETLDNLRKEMADVAIYSFSLTSALGQVERVSSSSKDEEETGDDDDFGFTNSLLHRIQSLWAQTKKVSMDGDVSFV